MSGAELSFEFRTPEQEQFFSARVRNQMFSGGFGNGKTFAGCMKIVYLLAMFPRYRVAIFRFDGSKLKETTMKTFYKVCPPALYDPALGGNRADSMNTCRLINGSEIVFMHLKDIDEGIVRGLEVNSVLVDQIEEISEYMFLMLSARVGRWDMAQVPQHLLDQNPDWPLDKFGKRRIPNYFLGLCNPDSELHWIYKRFHPESEEWIRKYHVKNVMIQGETTSNTIEPELLEEMKENDQAWVDRFVRGKWGIPGGAIHLVPEASILRVGKNIDLGFVKTIIERGNLTRILDHGDSAPTCCTWWSSYKNWYFGYREYYKPDTLISEHRKAIGALSGTRESYLGNYIDPACCKKTMQKYGGRWAVLDEYADPKLICEDGTNPPPLYWQPADNDELSSRNRISELLTPSNGILHPATLEPKAPRLYFIEQSPEYPNGMYHTIRQTKAAKREKIGTIDGKDIFSDDRDPNVVDHAYDNLRYYVASHSFAPSEARPRLPQGSIGWVRKQMKMLKIHGTSPHFSHDYNGERLKYE